MALNLLDLIKDINALVDDMRKIATNPETTAETISERMAQLETKMAEMRNFPDAEWQNARNDVLGLSANLNTMQQTLTAEYEKSRAELTQLSDRAKAQKLYATYEQPQELPQAPQPEPTPEEK